MAARLRIELVSYKLVSNLREFISVLGGGLGVHCAKFLWNHLFLVFDTENQEQHPLIIKSFFFAFIT